MPVPQPWWKRIRSRFFVDRTRERVMNVETIACAALADFLGGSPDEVAFGANRTTLTFHLGRALGRHWSADDELIVTELNALGTKSDVPRAADLAHAQGALAFVDAVHYAPHALIDMAALGADFLVSEVR